MNIKSLLLGSAAALVAVSGARAADAIVAVEPEPVEYVRVCDAFGTGFFYIPGTETCLRIHGYMRYDVFGGDLWAVTARDGDETWDQDTRFSLQVSTASETELGTLRTYAELRFNWNTVDTAAGYDVDNRWELNHGWIQLGGLRVGKSDSFFTTWTGYAGAVIHDTPLGGYGPFDTNLISYTYNGGAWRAGIALEQGNDSETLGDWGIDSYMPHVVAGLGFTFGMVDLSGVLAWDSRDEYLGVEQGGLSGKIRADVEFNDRASVFAMVMYGENSSAYTTWARGLLDDETLGVSAGGSFAFTDRATFNLQGDWVDGGDFVDDGWAVTANIAYELVPGLVITPEVAYVDDGLGVDEDGEFGGGLRIQRSF